MKQEQHEIDHFFREGFRREEQYVSETGKNRFEEFFAEGKRQTLPYWKKKTFRISMAASWVILAGILFQAFFSNDKSDSITVSDGRPSEVFQKEEPLLAAADSPSDKKTFREGAAPKISYREKNARKAPSTKSRNRRRQLPGPMLPGIFPATLLADMDSSAQPHQEHVQASGLPTAEVMESGTAIAASWQEENPFEIVSIDLFPGKTVSRSEMDNAASASLMNGSDADASAGFLGNEFEKVRSVEDAKTLIFKGIGRIIGVIPVETASENLQSNKYNNL